MNKKNKLYKDTKHYLSSNIYEVLHKGTMYPGCIPCVTYQNIERPGITHTMSDEAFYKRFEEVKPRINPKYIHYFSLNFEITSNVEGNTEQERAEVMSAAKSMVEEIVEQGKAHAVAPYTLEWYDTEYFDDVHGETEQS